MVRNSVLLCTTIFLVFVISGCVTCQDDVTKKRIGIDAINQMQSLWNDAGITNYIMQYSKIASGINPAMANQIRVLVENGEISTVNIYDNAGSLIMSVPTEHHKEYYVVNDLFETIRDLDSSVDTLEVTYDPILGYPSHIYVDPVDENECSNVADDDYSYTINIT